MKAVPDRGEVKLVNGDAVSTLKNRFPVIRSGTNGLFRVAVPEGFSGKFASVKIAGVDGRVVQRMDIVVSGGGYLNVDWNGRAANGTRVGAGVYYMSVDFGEERAVAGGLLF